MQLRRFYHHDFTAESTGIITLDAAESAHALRVLRLQPGDKLQVMNGRGAVAHCQLLPNDGSGKSRLARCEIMEMSTFPAPAHPITLYVAPPKGKAFDLVLKAAVELGFAAIQPFACEYGVAKYDDTPESWGQTLIGAMKQSANPYLPQLLSPVPFAQLQEHFPHLLVGASPVGEATAAQAITPQRLENIHGILVGPEGGLSRNELTALLQGGALPVTIGDGILRVETAVPALAGFLAGIRRALS